MRINNPRLDEAVNRLLDLVERPVGTKKCSLPASEEVSRRLVDLFDAAGRENLT